MYLLKQRIVWLLASLTPAYATTSITPLCPAHPATHEQQREIFDEFVQIFFVEKDMSKAFLTHVAEDYIQHSPRALSGRQNAIDGLTPLMPMVDLTVVHRAFEDNMGWVHHRADLPGRNVTGIVELWRMDGTCIVEHWDVIQTLTSDSQNPLAMFSPRTGGKEEIEGQHDEL